MILLLLLQIYVGPTDLTTPLWATPASFSADKVPFCRGYYTRNRYEANGSGWNTDYPGVDINLLVRMGELTNIKTGAHVVVRLNSPLLSNCSILFMSDVGTIDLSLSEIEGLRAYLLKGGFLWVDDFWGSLAWNQWIYAIRRVLPNAPIFTMNKDHPIFHQQFDVPGIWQMPTTGLWVFEDGTMQTSERGDDSLIPYMRGMLDSHGRLIVVMTFNTDIADGLEAAEWDENYEYFYEFSHRAYSLAINIFIYALTH